MEKIYRALAIATSVVLASWQSVAAQTTVIDIARDGADLVWQGVGAGASAGVVLDQGDLSQGDTRRDLIVGSPGGPGVHGRVYVIVGGPVRTGSLSLASADAIFESLADNDRFGSATAAGNILTAEGSGPRDLVVGAPNASAGRGAVYLFRGNLSEGTSRTTANAMLTIVGAAGDRLGTALATADLNGDNFRDIVIGAPGNNRIYVIAGGPSVSGTIDLAAAAPLFSFSAAGIGAELTAGDLNGDGLSEVVMGSPSTNMVLVLAGRRSLPYPATADWIFSGIDVGDRAGTAVRILDLDGNNRRDLAISAPGGDGPGNGRPDAGEVYVIWGSATLAGRHLSLADVTFYGSAAGFQSGSFLAAGDINRDLPNDIVIGCPTAEGRSEIHIYYGRSPGRMGTAAGTQRVVDLAITGQIDRWILSDDTVGTISAAQVYEATGEGARDIVVSVPTVNASAGAVYFTISPKMRLSRTSLSMVVNEGGTAQAPVEILNRSTVWISWAATSNQTWLSGAPASGNASQSLPATVNVTVNAAGLAPGNYTGTLKVASTADDLTMTISIAVSLSVTGTRMAMDIPAHGSTVSQPFSVAGWAVDVRAPSGTGVSEVHVYAYPNPGSGQAPIFLGAAAYGGGRPDVGALFGSRFTDSGYHLSVAGLTPGTLYQIAAFAKSTVSGEFGQAVANVVRTEGTAPDPGPQPNPNPTGPATFTVDRARLTFGARRAGAALNAVTPEQTIVVSQTGGAPMAWTATASHAWIRLSHTGGTGSGAFTVSVQDVSLPNLGTFDGTIVVSSPGGATPPQQIAVRLKVMANGTTAAPIGVIDTPVNGTANVAGAIPVTGWAVDDIVVSRVEIYRDPVNGEPTHPNGKVFIGNGAFVAGARPDVEALHAEKPMAYRGGWGYLLLTNVLPDISARTSSGGNGSFTLHAYAVDAEGLTSYLGAKQFTANNRGAVKPFGTLDTPSQGGTISGTAYVSFGWALSPRGVIPADGSTIMLYIDGVPVGRPTYNNFRSDIANAFPGLPNSNGAVGHLTIDTTRLTNGVHTIGWLVFDTAGNGEGLGSRFFTVFNGGGAAATAAVQSSSVATSGAIGKDVGQQTEVLDAVPIDNNIVEVRKAFNAETPEQLVVPEWSGEVKVNTKEMEQIELRLANEFTDGLGGTFEGYLVIGGEMRPLPIGSALESNGTFTWQLGPGFVGDYEFVFVRTIGDGLKTKVPVKIAITPKFERERQRKIR